MSLLIEKPVDDAETIPAVGDEEADVSMSALLDLTEVRDIIFPISVEAYHLLTDDEPTELLRGIIIKKVSKSPTHRYIARRVQQILSGQIATGFEVFYGDPLTFIDSEPEPDVAVVRGSESEFEDVHPPTAELVVEVAVTSLAIDRKKARIYAEAGIKEYWIVRPAIKAVEVYRQPTAKGYVDKLTVAAPAVLQCTVLSGVSVDLAALFAEAR